MRIETPRLCGVPGFDGEWGLDKPEGVACREILADGEWEKRLVEGGTEVRLFVAFRTSKE